MRRFSRNPAVKAISALLAVVLSGLTVTAAGAILFMYTQGYYSSEVDDFYDTHAFYQTTQYYAQNVYDRWQETIRLEGEAEDAYPEQEYNFAYTIRHAVYPDNVLESNYTPSGEVVELSYPFGRYEVDIYVQKPIAKNDAYWENYLLFQFLFPHRIQIPIAVGIGVLLVFVALIILVVGAGRRRGTEEVVLCWQDRIPLDLYLAVGGIAELVLIAFSFTNIHYYDYWGWVFAGWMTMVIGSVGIAMLLSVITRFKAGQWWKNTILYRAAAFGKRCLVVLGRILSVLVRALPLLWKVLLGFCVAIFVNYVLLYAAFHGYWINGFVLFISLLFNFILLLGVGLAALNMQRLKQAGEKLAAGNFEQRVDKQWMVMDFLEHAKNLDSIGDGMAIAVQHRIRSERLKTELITNVSHDIKTPLTSIINYVDLLKKEPLPEKAGEYAAVLDRHAKRLKKLTEDIVEASKASTGNVSIVLQRTGLCELINQSVGEYAERLEECSLEPVITVPENSELYIMADGRRLWRVVDNLLSNACKYAQPGTRVYIDIEKQGNQAVVTIKNISRNRLNIAAEELIERFVRGDASRVTEGSGLGLNIAQSLVELQKGHFGLVIDGDLFKAELRFDLIESLPQTSQRI